MRLTLDETSLASLDALCGIDALCLFVAEDERPLRGLAGYADWRLGGALSNILRSRHFIGAPGDCLLFPVGHGVRVQRAFCFGLGPRQAFQPEQSLGALLQSAMAVLGKAGCRSFAMELPCVTDDGVERAGALFVEAGLGSFAGDELILLDRDPRSMSRALQKSAPALERLRVALDDRVGQSIVDLKKGASRGR